MTITDRDRKILMFIVPVVLVLAYWFLLFSPKRDEAAKLGDELAQAETTRDQAVARAQGVSSAKGQFAADFAEVLRVGKAIPTTVDMPALIVQLDKAAGGTGIGFQSIKAGQRTEAQPPPPAPAENSQPTDAGGEQAATPVGQAAEAANESAETSDQANAASGADPATAGTAATGTATPGLDTVPLDFAFEGDFFELADFFHRLKRFVHVRGDRIVVGGRLMTIDSFTLSMGQTFPTLTAEMTATVYLSPMSEGATAGATPQGPATESAPTTSTSSPSQ
jgi:hypothetical protein